MKRTVSITLSLEIEVEVSGDYQKETFGSYCRSNGDVGDPPSPAEFDVYKVMWQGIDIAPLLEKEGYSFRQIEGDCLEKIYLLNEDLYSNYDF